jgi:hypothetical protein
VRLLVAHRTRCVLDPIERANSAEGAVIASDLEALLSSAPNERDSDLNVSQPSAHRRTRPLSGHASVPATAVVTPSARIELRKP